MAIDFMGSHNPKSLILYAVFFYVRYGVSYRDLEEIMAERGVDVEHATPMGQQKQARRLPDDLFGKIESTRRHYQMTEAKCPMFNFSFLCLSLVPLTAIEPPELPIPSPIGLWPCLSLQPHNSLLRQSK